MIATEAACAPLSFCVIDSILHPSWELGIYQLRGLLIVLGLQMRRCEDGNLFGPS